MKALAVLFCFVGICFANNAEEFFYKRGYELGYNSGFDRGVEAGLAAAKEALKKYKSEIDSYEVGKYLIASRKLTYPQVWQELDENGGITLRVIPSRIESNLDIDDLLTRYTDIPTRPKTEESILTLSLEEQNSVNLSNRDSNNNDLPEIVSERIKNITKLSLEKTSDHLEILKQSNFIYSDEGDSYVVLFFSEQEKNDFCKNFLICDKGQK
ncbi:hypothetical protein CCZ01_09340 [Helicobacter monodelphidis]|uniref:hypothetical protein n=1 Tax=Helicobacter sp. 15-1451 TaxID=2004995 RepID=UPI000DCD573D|nr:hypothetical protein [Helicobacter sp. 15-1451]RAX56488.1 hypothetical protein CCZ01_09340 [Helicobacter sp. 15-1451]